MFYRARRRLESRRGKHECSRHVVAHALFACRLGTLAETFGIRSLRTHLTKLSDIAQECVRHNGFSDLLRMIKNYMTLRKSACATGQTAFFVNAKIIQAPWRDTREIDTC